MDIERTILKEIERCHLIFQAMTNYCEITNFTFVALLSQIFPCVHCLDMLNAKQKNILVTQEITVDGHRKSSRLRLGLEGRQQFGEKKDQDQLLADQDRKEAQRGLGSGYQLRGTPSVSGDDTRHLKWRAAARAPLSLCADVINYYSARRCQTKPALIRRRQPHYSRVSIFSS